MSSYNLLKKAFSLDNLNYTYYHKIRPKAVAGLDKIDKYKFDEIKEDEFKTINRKVLNGKYNFTRYKKVLINNLKVYIFYVNFFVFLFSIKL